MARIEVKYFNTFLIKKLTTVVAATGLTPPYTNVPGDYTATPATDWYAEESRIRGGYNNKSVDFGVKAYLDEENPLQQNRFNFKELSIGSREKDNIITKYESVIQKLTNSHSVFKG